jgi:hypothetical protein
MADDIFSLIVSRENIVSIIVSAKILVLTGFWRMQTLG